MNWAPKEPELGKTARRSQTDQEMHAAMPQRIAIFVCFFPSLFQIFTKLAGPLSRPGTSGEHIPSPTPPQPPPPPPPSYFFFFCCARFPSPFLVGGFPRMYIRVSRSSRHSSRSVLYPNHSLCAILVMPVIECEYVDGQVGWWVGSVGIMTDGGRRIGVAASKAYRWGSRSPPSPRSSACAESCCLVFGVWWWEGGDK